LFAFWPCSYSPLFLSQLFAFCVPWCLAFLLRNAVLCVLSCFLIADCSFSFGLVDVMSLCYKSSLDYCVTSCNTKLETLPDSLESGETKLFAP
jgi:hypothetical protein